MQPHPLDATADSHGHMAAATCADRRETDPLRSIGQSQRHSPSTMTLSFAVPDEFHQALLRLVASSSGLGEAQLSITVGGVTDVEFTVDGTQAFGAHTACRFIAGLSPAASQLLGDSPEQQAKVRCCNDGLQRRRCTATAAAAACVACRQGGPPTSRSSRHPRPSPAWHPPRVCRWPSGWPSTTPT